MLKLSTFILALSLPAIAITAPVYNFGDNDTQRVHCNGLIEYYSWRVSTTFDHFAGCPYFDATLNDDIYESEHVGRDEFEEYDDDNGHARLELNYFNKQCRTDY